MLWLEQGLGGALCCSVPPCFKASECDRDVEEKERVEDRGPERLRHQGFMALICFVCKQLLDGGENT
jgi:hypothetical protein